MTNKNVYNNIAENYKKISENINEALIRANRTDKVRLMAVTKTVDTDYINYAASLGIELLGENRVQEFLQKYENYTNFHEIHFIGGLQNNKVKYIIDKVQMIHSLDSEKLAVEINKKAHQKNLVMDCLVEINIGNEDSKSGILKESLWDFMDKLQEFQNIRVRGLMTIPPLSSGNNDIYFGRMEEIFLDLQSKYGKMINTLSMGMSADYEKAIKYRSNLVRIGSALFGKRDYHSL